MKKILAAAAVVILLAVLPGCTPPKFAAMRDHQIRIIETHAPMLYGDSGDGGWIDRDTYGRELFIYIEDGIRFFGICQLRNDDATYCYEDVCFLLCPEGDTSEQLMVEELKLVNDWDSPMHWEKMSNVEWREGREWRDFHFYDAEKMITNYILSSGETVDFLQALDADVNGKELFFVTIRTENNVDRYYFILLFPWPYRSEPCFFEVRDIYNYAGRLHAFKNLNRWDIPDTEGPEMPGHVIIQCVAK